MNAHTHGHEGKMECAALSAREGDYLAGTLAEADAIALELHAAECATCGARLDALTRRDVGAYAPTLPAEARAATLTRVRERTRARRSRRSPWTSGLATVAAAAVLTMAVLGPWRGDLARLLAPPASTPAQASGPRAATTVTALTEPVAIATARSASEFVALDAAARELEQALAAAPDDDELRDFLDAVRARRAELQRRVQDAAS